MREWIPPNYQKFYLFLQNFLFFSPNFKQSPINGLGTSKVIVASGATLNVECSISNNITLSGTGYDNSGALLISSQWNDTLSGNITLAADAMIKSNIIDKYLSGVISGEHNVTFGGGYLHLQSVNTYTGTTTITNGALVLDIADAIKTSSGVINNAQISTKDKNQTFNNLSGTNSSATIAGYSSGTGILTLNNTSDSSYAGIITDTYLDSIRYARDIKKTGTGTLTLSGKNTYTGTTTVSEGTLKLTDSNTTSGVRVGANGTLDLTAYTGSSLKILSSEGSIQAGSQTIGLTVNVAENTAETFSAAVSGSNVTLAKTGDGTLNMNYADTAPLTIKSIQSSAGRLNLKGSYAANLTITGGTFSPGNSVGTMNLDGNYVLKNGSTLDFELDGSAADLMIVEGDATFERGSAISLSVTDAANFQKGAYTLFSATGTVTRLDTFDWASILTASGLDSNVWTLSANGNSLSLTATMLPEPSTLLLLIPGILGLFGFRRRLKICEPKV